MFNVFRYSIHKHPFNHGPPYSRCLKIQSIWLLRRALAEHTGPEEWRATVAAQLVALAGRLWLETHPNDPALRQAAVVSDDDEIGMIH